MATHGEKLKETRLKQGKSIHEIAEQTRISSQFLEAIEADQLDAIPGAFFRRSFLKQYAKALGLNPEEFQPERPMEFRSLGGAAEEMIPEVRLHKLPDLPPLPAMGQSRSFPWRQIFLSVGLLVGVLAICAVAYTLWEDYQVTRGRQESASVEVAPPPQPALIPEPAAQLETHPAPSDTELESSSTGINSVPANPSSTTARTESPAPTLDTAAAPEPPADPEVSTASSVHGSGSRELRLSASATTWVQAREGERTVFVGVINPGQTRVLRLNEGARLVVGNAGGLNVVWQGEDVGAVGPLGQVRIVTVTPEGVSVAAPVKAAPPGETPSSARQGS
ncbi:MAG: DUF4115 domain-containing protein [Bryobacterales bacterium]|nr:DUF4115 domain-containing protein [Bryobacterales bacterium]